MKTKNEKGKAENGKIYHTTALKAFTLLEVMLVVIIVGIMLILAIPQYTKTIDRSRLQDGMNQLTAVHAANLIYKAQNGKYYDGSQGTDHNALNLALKINIIPGNLVYLYSYNSVSDFYTLIATLTKSGTTYTLTLNQNPISSGNPNCGCTGSCTVNACP